MCLSRGGVGSTLVCGACLRTELAPLRSKLQHMDQLLPWLQLRCRQAYRDGERAVAGRRALQVAQAESLGLEATLRELGALIAAERIKAAAERRRLVERSKLADRGQAALAARRAEFAAVRRAVHDGRRILESSPWRRAVESFALFPIQHVSPPSSKGSSLRGVAAIVGLPLPNVGSAVLASSSLPRSVCRAALAAAAQLVASVAAALRVDLPHPLSSRLDASGAAAVDERPTRHRRRYALAPPEAAASKPDHDAFATALHLLQNNVTHVCVKAGVPASDLWPAEAILLNLIVLRDRARDELAKSAGNDKLLQELPHATASSSDAAPDDDTDEPEASAPSPDDDNDDWIFLAASKPSFGVTNAPR